MKKRIVAAVLCIAMTTMMIGCGSSASSAPAAAPAEEATSDSAEAAPAEGGSESVAEANTKFKLGITINALDATTNRKMFQSAQAYAESLGIEVIATNAGDSTKQADDIENLVQSGCNAIILMNADGSVCKNAVKEAADAGVYIISEESGWMDGVSSMVSLNNFKTGAEMCNAVLAKIGYSGKVILTGHYDHPTIRAHLNVFKIMADEYPGIEVTNEIHTVYPGTTEVTYEGVASALVQNPDTAAIICTQDLEALGAVQALKEADMYPNIPICAHDGSLDVMNEIKNNDCILMTILPDTVATTKLAVDTAVKLVNGEKVDPYYEEPYIVVTDENVDECIKQAEEDEKTYASK